MGIELASPETDPIAAVLAAMVWIWPLVGAIVLAVISTVLVPWLTVQRTKDVERRDKEQASRTEAASVLLRAAGDLYMDKERLSEQRSGKVYILDFHQAAAQVLILSVAGRSEATEYFRKVPESIFRGESSFTLELAEVLGSWVADGRFVIGRLPKATQQQIQARS